MRRNWPREFPKWLCFVLNRRLSQFKPDFAQTIINCLINKTGLRLIAPRKMTRGAVGLIAQPRSLPRRCGVITRRETSSGLSRFTTGMSNATHARVFAVFIYSRCVRRLNDGRTAGDDRMQSQAFGNNLTVAVSRSRGASIARKGGTYMSDTHASKRYGVFENGNEMSTIITGTVLYQALLRNRTSSRYGTVYGLSRFFSKPVCLEFSEFSRFKSE